MATTENLHRGNGKTKFSFTFPYLNQSDVEVYVYSGGSWGTKKTLKTEEEDNHYFFANATTIEFNTAQADPSAEDEALLGDKKNIKIKRNTSSDSLAATFYPGSAIRAGDLNDNYTQNLYVTQEASNLVTDANTDAAAALTKATAAETDADASILATDAFVAKNTAAAGETPVWVVRGNGDGTSGTDSSGASDPQSGVGKAVTDSASALAKALEAIADADNAVATADAAESAVSTVLPYTIKGTAQKVQDLFGTTDAPACDSDGKCDIYEITSTADLPDFIKGATWAQNTAYKVNDQVFTSKLYRCTVAGTSHSEGTGPSHSTGEATDGSVTWVHQSDSNGKWDITSKPDPMPTFSAGITVKLKYTSGNGTASVWSWQSYHANNPEVRYAPTASPTLTSPTFLTSVDIDGATQIDATVTVGVDDTGYDVKFFGDTASAYLLWDTSADSLLTGGDATIDIVKDKLKIGGTAVTTTAAELNVLDGIPGTLTATELGYVDGVTSAIQTQLDAKGVGDATKAGTNAWTGVNSNAPEALTSGTSITIDFSTSNNFKLTTGHSTIAFAEPTTEIEGQSGSIFITQGSTTCAAPSWHEQFLFAAGAPPSLTATEGAIARIDYIVQEAGKIHCVATDNLIAIPS